jgi:hypothetical protein
VSRAPWAPVPAPRRAPRALSVCPGSDSVVCTWRRAVVTGAVWRPQVDGFRFDIMGHLMVDTMMRIRAALGALTLEADGVDGERLYIYGEAWDFGEVRAVRVVVGPCAGAQLSVCLSVCLFVCLSVCLSVCCECRALGRAAAGIGLSRGPCRHARWHRISVAATPAS